MKALHEEIHELNLAYLMLAQRLISDDKWAAMARMGIDEDQCDALENLSVANIVTLSKHNQFLFSFNLSGDAINRALTVRRGNNQSTLAAHLSIALATNEGKN